MGLLFLLLLLLCTHPFRVRTLGSPRGRPSHGSVRYFDYPEEITCAPSGVVVRIRNDSFQGMFIRLSIVDNYGIPRDLHSLPSSCPYTTLPQEDGSLLFSTPYKGCYVHLMNNTVSLELRIDGIDESKRIMVIERIPLSCILPSLPSVTTMGPTNGTLLTTKEPVNTTAMTTPLTKEPMDITVTKEPVDTTAVTTPLTKEPMDITVTKKPVDTTAMTLPTKEPVDTTAVTLPTKEPVDTTAMTLPTKEPVDTTAVTTPLTKEPVDTTAVTLPTKEPVDTTAMTLPTKEPVDTTAVTTPLTKEPVDTTAVTLPTKEPVDTTAVPLPTKEPVDATAVTTPLTKEPMDITVTKEPVDTTAVPLPTKEPVDTTAVTTPLTKEPVDTTAVTTPLTKEPMDITVTKEPVDTTAVPLPTKEPVDTTAVTTPLTKEPMDITVTKEPVDTTAVPLPTKEPVDTTAVPLPTKEPVDTTAVPLPTKEPVDTTAVTTPLTKEPMGITVTKEPVDTTAVTLPTKEPVDTSVTALVTKEPVNTTVLLSTKELGSAATTIPPVGQTTGFTATSVGTDLKPNGDTTHICGVEVKDRVDCGNATLEECNAKGCCYDPINKQTPCFYGKTAYIDCSHDGLFTIVVPRVATVPALNLSSIALMNHTSPQCLPITRTTEFVLFRFPLDSCGTTQIGDGLNITYSVDIIAKRKIQSGPRGSITRESTFKLHVKCHFSGKRDIPLTLVVNTASPLPSILREGVLQIEMRIAKEKSYSTWFADEDYPLVKFLREPVYVEVRLLHRTDPNIELVLNDCWATQTLDPHQAPRWSILLHGCPYYKDNYLSQLHAVDAASNLSFPTHHKRFEVKTFAFWNQEIQTALSGEVYFHCSVTVCPLPDMQECTTTCGADRRMARHSDFNTSDKAAYHGLVTLKRPIVFALAEGKTADLSQANAKTTDGVLLAAAITSLVLALICGLVVCWNCKQMPMS
ncbi:mucin-17-like isoform X1 [Stegostoma tigrinum]|uniref:mucin-17-like isoform X1 n=1 Tax=Stegostoma tigrinum TaxID=3053191 RepID=UPI0028709D30|nr:mucin-17-like isoform X1 [Stegostoma tigrinum]